MDKMKIHLQLSFVTYRLQDYICAAYDSLCVVIKHSV